MGVSWTGRRDQGVIMGEQGVRVWMVKAAASLDSRL